MQEHFTLRYSASADGNSILDLEMNYDNPTDEVLVKRIQSWLIVIGKPNIHLSLANEPKEVDRAEDDLD